METTTPPPPAKVYNGAYVTVAMIAEHCRKAVLTVHRGLARSKTPTEKFPGVNGIRIRLADANRFISRQWPEVGPIPQH